MTFITIMGEPIIRTTVVEDVATFQEERKLFLDEQRRFKIGMVRYGPAAASTLRSMYVELIYSVHYEKNKEEALNYLTRLDKAYESISKLQSNPTLKESQTAVCNPLFLAEVKKLDELYVEMKRFKRLYGFG